MTSPFDATRRAVTGGKIAPAFQPNQPAVAVYNAALGGMIATFPATAYPRYLDTLTTVCSVVCPVHVHAGPPTPASRLTSHGDGSLADYSPPSGRYIPGGVQVTVVWAPTPANATASCNAQFRQAT